MEEVERVRRDVCAYKERSLVGSEGPPVEEENVAPVPGSCVVVMEETVEEATCTLLLQLFWAATPIGHTPSHQQKRKEWV